MTFSIRKATKSDMPRVLELIVELAIYEKEPDAVKNHTRRFASKWF